MPLEIETDEPHVCFSLCHKQTLSGPLPHKEVGPCRRSKTLHLRFT